ncbi:hypothetical protein ebA1550 [Aromatoleum aromaticum EbN1]|uniref:Uncharacterized protein n=1 Tax=Aromatoleum aromaticum (strain DSM 19018 / LMG 30748 / EbN1) TaxID=76114 RepID=Q5P6T8_AROAE|nr:hypothetical protein ebA1550 [Aromatoleum aromaticum EbN1]
MRTGDRSRTPSDVSPCQAQMSHPAAQAISSSASSSCGNTKHMCCVYQGLVRALQVCTGAR